MVTRTATSVLLGIEPSLDVHVDTTEANLDVACADMHLDGPHGGLALPGYHEASFRVRQFPPRTITDNPPRSGHVGLTTGFSPFGSGPSDDELNIIRDRIGTAPDPDNEPPKGRASASRRSGASSNRRARRGGLRCRSRWVRARLRCEPASPAQVG